MTLNPPFFSPFFSSPIDNPSKARNIQLLTRKMYKYFRRRHGCCAGQDCKCTWAPCPRSVCASGLSRTLNKPSSGATSGKHEQLITCSRTKEDKKLERVGWGGGSRLPLILLSERRMPLILLHLRRMSRMIRHCKKRLAIFPSPGGMSPTKLSLAGNNLIIPS